MHMRKLGNWKGAMVAAATVAAVAVSLAGTAKPAAADSIRWGIDIHIGGRGHGGYGYYDDDRYRRDRYDDYRYRRDRDYDDYRYRRDRDDDYRYRRGRYDDYRYRR